MDIFTTAYLEALFFASTDDNGQPLDRNYGPRDMAPESMAQVVSECAAFQAAHGADIESGRGYEHAGHDFFLTRNGHGAGFWDGDWPDAVGERLTVAAKSFGESDPYVGDDGAVYVFPHR